MEMESSRSSVGQPHFRPLQLLVNTCETHFAPNKKKPAHGHLIVRQTQNSPVKKSSSGYGPASLGCYVEERFDWRDFARYQQG